MTQIQTNASNMMERYLDELIEEGIIINPIVKDKVMKHFNNILEYVIQNKE